MPTTPTPSSRTFVIVGASLAGAKAAETLRSEGFDGRVVLVGAEPERPYERPALSKDYLRGDVERGTVFVHDENFYAEQSIELRTGTRVRALRLNDHEVVLEGDESIHYDRLLLTTGARPRRLRVPGAGLTGVHSLRTIADADRLAASLREATNVVVVGAGWIGSEVAASARVLGRTVAIVDPAAVPLQRVLGDDVGAVYRDLHADHGVELHLGTGIDSLGGHDRVKSVHLSNGTRLPADLVVVGIGAEPRTELATEAGLAVGDGITVNELLQSDHPDVFAAGDVAAAYHPHFAARLRVEHWANAMHQGAAAAKNMLGIRAPYDRMPYFFSDQYDLGMEYSGYAPDWDRVVFRGDPAEGKFIAFWLASNVVVAGMNANVWDVTDQIQRLVRNRVAVSPEQLADADKPLETLT